jgi:hypothetical protein
MSSPRLQAPRATRVTQASLVLRDPLAHRVLLVLRVFKVRPAIRDPPVMLALPEPTPAFRVRRGIRVTKAIREMQVPKDLRVPREFRALRETKATPETPAQLVLPDPRVSKEFRV